MAANDPSPNHPGKTVHVIFKTHLDIGFTDFAARVQRRYHEHFLPMAIETAEHFLQENPAQPKFIWTTGAWLIHEHLETGSTAQRRNLERAINNGVIAWHALPFTTHTELLSAELFEAGLGYSKDLDRRFGRQTSGAKMTDVPGHTLGIVPILARSGVRFLHIGVNPASTVPKVPPAFRWRARGGEEIVVFYERDYGATHFPEGWGEGLGFAHTADNIGPQSLPQVVETHRLFARDNPDANIKASTLSEFGDIAWARRDTLPVVEEEIGDSWVHGVGTAPVKVARFMALRRLYSTWQREGLTPEREDMARRLGMVAEHTWGVDIKTFLPDETAWDRPDFEAARKTDPRFAMAELSWAEQDELIDKAVDALDTRDRAAVESAMPATLRPSDDAPVAQAALSVGGGQLTFDESSGGVRSIRFPGGAKLAASDGLFATLAYESYDAQDYRGYIESYVTERVHWSLSDHGKPGLENAGTAFSGVFRPDWLGACGERQGQAIAKFRYPAKAHDDLGAPRDAEIRYGFVGRNTLEITVCLFAKPANRMPEAGFLTFTPALDPMSWRFRKLGYDIDPRSVVENGNRQLHAVESVSGATDDGLRLTIEPIDSPLVGPAEATFLNFFRGDVTMEAGIRFCLHNNKWGTNFPMWCEGDLVFRFRLTVSSDG